MDNGIDINLGSVGYIAAQHTHKAPIARGTRLQHLPHLLVTP